MKSYVAVPLLATFALAQSQSDGPNCGIITQPPLDDTYPASTAPIAAALVAINATTVALNQSIDAFDGTASSIANLQGAANAVLANINGGIANTTDLPVNGDDDDGQIASLSLITYVGGLSCTANATVDNLINSADALINACVGPIVLFNLQQQQNASLQFEAVVKSKISPSLQDQANVLTDPINIAFASGVAAYADQTALPASCSLSSSTTGTAGPTATGNPTATGTTTGSGAQPTGGNGGWQVYGGSSAVYSPSAVYPTYGSKPTGGSTYPVGGGDDDCDEYPSTYGSKPTGGNTWTPVGGDDDDCEDDVPSTYGSKPTAPVSQGWQAVTTGGSGSKPTYPASSGWQAVTTPKPSPNTTWAPYKGAASGNVANGIGAAAIAVFAAAALL